MDENRRTLSDLSPGEVVMLEWRSKSVRKQVRAISSLKIHFVDGSEFRVWQVNSRGFWGYLARSLPSLGGCWLKNLIDRKTPTPAGAPR